MARLSLAMTYLRYPVAKDTYLEAYFCLSSYPSFKFEPETVSEYVRHNVRACAYVETMQSVMG